MLFAIVVDNILWEVVLRFPGVLPGGIVEPLDAVVGLVIDHFGLEDIFDFVFFSHNSINGQNIIVRGLF